MRYKLFGSTNRDVSVIGFGAGSISGEGGGYGFGSITETQAISLVRQAYDLGINLFDTAPIYGHGLSEQRLGKALAEIREKVLIVSKCGVSWNAKRKPFMSNDPDLCVKMLEQTLRDLNTDYVDLYMVHWPDPKVDIRVPLEALKPKVESGAIRALGLCNTSVADLEKAKEVTIISAVQNEYNLFNRSVEESLLPYLTEHNIGFMGYGTLDKGILSGTVTPDRKYESCDSRSRAPWWIHADHTPKFRAMTKIGKLLDAAGCSKLNLAVGFVLSRPEVSTALIGVRSEEQLHRAIAAAESSIREDLIEEAKAIIAEELS